MRAPSIVPPAWEADALLRPVPKRAAWQSALPDAVRASAIPSRGLQAADRATHRRRDSGRYRKAFPRRTPARPGRLTVSWILHALAQAFRSRPEELRVP